MSQTIRSPSLDAKLQVLSDSRRRCVVRELAAHRPDECPSSASLVPTEADNRTAARVNLQHVHLPKLEDGGFVEWDAAADTVQRGPAFEELLSLLEAMSDHEDDSK
jgi:hypothetical protein